MDAERAHKMQLYEKRFELEKKREDNQALLAEALIKAMTALQNRWSIIHCSA